MIVEKDYTEGRVTFVSADVEHYTKGKKQVTSDIPVFYNPRMQLNRDLSVLFLSSYMSDNKIEIMCEPLAGCGVRTLRYLRECPGDFQALMFDANPFAVETIQKNIAGNGFQDRARVVKGDAKVLLLEESREKRFDFVDVDPFGSPAPYLNAAIQSLNPRKGLLSLTATDMPALCGVYPRVALRKYGGISIRTPFVHELAVRLLIGLSFSIAGLNDSMISPLAVLSTDHYVRVWLETKADRINANRQTANFGLIRYCSECMHSDSVPMRDVANSSEFTHQKKRCDGKLKLAGPLWIGPLFSQSLLERAERLIPDNIVHRKTPDLIRLMIGEANLTKFPYLDIHDICDLYNLVPPRREHVITFLIESGYRAVRTHFRPTAIRTNATSKDVADAIKRLNAEDKE
ncbi:MAG: tRNA (guanine(10)-N(2))-dimethyltransferase [Candidatus Hodarchaeota archaeon]